MPVARDQSVSSQRRTIVGGPWTIKPYFFIILFGSLAHGLEYRILVQKDCCTRQDGAISVVFRIDVGDTINPYSCRRVAHIYCREYACALIAQIRRGRSHK